jgi:LAO/AO transport system kinase
MDTDLIASVGAGDRRALARAITLVEDGEALDTGDSSTTPVIGITGPPGSGKSTLISGMIDALRRRGETVAVLAVDPSSPLTGGALLGDRIRMQGHAGDEGVYIRSMATRGHLGGLAAPAGAALRLMGLAGFDHVFVETVGVGQSEVEVMGLADVVVLVVGPSWGDHVQADKAGVVEIADVIVVNKADRPGAEEVRKALVEVAGGGGTPLLLTSAATGEGIDRLLAAVDDLAGV